METNRENEKSKKFPGDFLKSQKIMENDPQEDRILYTVNAIAAVLVDKKIVTIEELLTYLEASRLRLKDEKSKMRSEVLQALGLSL